MRKKRSCRLLLNLTDTERTLDEQNQGKTAKKFLYIVALFLQFALFVFELIPRYALQALCRLSAIIVNIA